MLWLLYHILFAIGFLLLLPRFLWRMRRRGGYRAHFRERFARYTPDVAARLSAGSRIWIHAVSVGETSVALGLMRRWRALRPDARWVLSVTTSTARAVAAQALAPDDVLIYFPLDFPWIARRALNRIRPRALVLVETEFWPTLVRACDRRGIPVLLANGRVSDRSFPRYRLVRAFTRRILPLLRALGVQADQDRERLLALGAPPDHTRVLGSAKYEAAEPDPAAEAAFRSARQALAGGSPDRPVWIGGSTWPGEEDILLNLHRELLAETPGLLLILAPRHAERADDVARLIAARGLSYVRRSGKPGSAPPPDGAADVLLLDTTGELKHTYAGAEVIFVGKSLTQTGGQNFIEPAAGGRAVICGPHLENFIGPAREFSAAGAFVQVADAGELRAAVRRLLGDPAARAELGARAAALVRAKSGALARTVEWFDALVTEADNGASRPGKR